MAAVISGSRSRHEMAFASVFPSKDYTTPTPEATPNIGVLASPGRSFGGFNTSTTANNEVRLSRAWSAATRALAASSAGGNIRNPNMNWEVQDAFDVLCGSLATRNELLAWFQHSISSRFRQQVLPKLQPWQQPVSASDAAGLLDRTVTHLSQAQGQYLYLQTQLESSASDTDKRANLRAFFNLAKEKLHICVLNSLPTARLHDVIAHVYYQQMKASLNGDANRTTDCFQSDECHCSLALDRALLARMQNVGLGGHLGERAFAHAVNHLLRSTVMDKKCFQVDWSGQSTVVPKLRAWIRARFSPFMAWTLAVLNDGSTFSLSELDRKQFSDIAVTNLGRQRTSSLFDYIKSWPNSKGAILDIREYLGSSNASEKTHVCSSFIEQMQRRLLHAGATTTEILSIYVSLIYVFRSLDARGVLLEKVAGPIRAYLRTRDDTVNVIAGSFLAEVDEIGTIIQGDVEKVCGDLTVEVAKSTLEDGRDHKTLNWDDMDWVPDPIDAGPDYQASRSEDILAYILNLFDQDDFVTEVKNVLAQHLLRADDPEYVKETRLVELFKSRLDATKLQAAEVMLKDVRDSVALNKRINPQAKSRSEKPPTPKDIQAAIPAEGITLSSLYRMFEHRMKQAQFQATLKMVATRRNDLFYPKRTRLPIEPEKSEAEMADSDAPDFEVTVLSSHFWPQMRSSEFVLPSQFVELAETFHARFNLLGSQRKLHWRAALTRMTVELELEDRQIKEVDVQAWHASVINAFSFSEDTPDADPPSLHYDPDIGLTPDQLAESLSMDDELVQDALNFWTGKRVLYQMRAGSYAVLERLDQAVNAIPLPPSGGDAGALEAIMSHDALLREGAPMFEAFIANMLRNGGAMAVEGMMGITGMLKMVLPTFTYGDEEVKWLLGEMEGRGEVERSGEVWKVVG